MVGEWLLIWVWMEINRVDILLVEAVGAHFVG